MKQEPKYWREKGGRFIHDGDCEWWGKSICSCGLLHHLKWFESTPGWAMEEEALMFYAIDKHGYGLDRHQRWAVRWIGFSKRLFSKVICLFLGHRVQEILKMKVCSRCCRWLEGMGEASDA